MSEFIELMRFLEGTGTAVIPWLVVSLVTYLVYKCYPYLIDWIKARSLAQREIAKAQTELSKREAERNEIMRNNNVVIENCTQTMKITTEYIKDTESRYLARLETHEGLSEERMTRLQAVLNRNAQEIGKIRGDIGILLDRTN